MQGCFRDDFDASGLGDLIDCSDDEGAGKPDNKAAPSRRGGALPSMDGPESVDAYIGKFKKTVLSKRQARREAVDRLTADNCTGYQNLASIDKKPSFVGVMIQNLLYCYMGSMRSC